MARQWVSTGLPVPTVGGVTNLRGALAAISFGGDIFILTNSNGSITAGPNLYRSVGGTAAFTAVADIPQNGSSQYAQTFSDLIVYGGSLYGWSNSETMLFKWNGSNAWIFVGQGDLVGSFPAGAIVWSTYILLNAHGRMNYSDGTFVSLAHDFGFDYVEGGQMAITAGGDVYAGSSSGRLFRRTNAGVYSELIATQLNGMGYSVPFILGSSVYAVMQNGRIYQYTGAGVWTQIIGDTVAGSIGVCHALVDSGILYMGIQAEANNVGGQLYSWDGVAGACSLLSARYSNYDNIGQVFKHGSRLMAIAYRYNSNQPIALLEYRDAGGGGVFMPAFVGSI